MIAQSDGCEIGDIDLAQSYRVCETIARRAASSFYPAFRLLPGDQRRAMCALYAFLRIADDISDEPTPAEDKRRQLQSWREGLSQALSGNYRHPIYPALHDAVRRHTIPPRYLEAALDGVEMDIFPTAFETFADLHQYCYRVASVVGLACIHIWGFAGARTEEYAVHAGIAFQLTNILRDLGEDAGRGRVYLPREDLDRFGYRAEQFQRGQRDGGFRDLMRFEIARARSYYESCWPLAPLLEPAGRTVFLVMARSYQALLNAMEQRDYDVFSRRVRVSRWRKAAILLGALPARWGW